VGFAFQFFFHIPPQYHLPTSGVHFFGYYKAMLPNRTAGGTFHIYVAAVGIAGIGIFAKEIHPMLTEYFIMTANRTCKVKGGQRYAVGEIPLLGNRF
jgi:hypothetical protein